MVETKKIDTTITTPPENRIHIIVDIPVNTGQAVKRQILGCKFVIKKERESSEEELKEMLKEVLEKGLEEVFEEELLMSSNVIIHPKKTACARIVILDFSQLALLVSPDEASNLLYCFEDTKLHVGSFRGFSDQLSNNSSTPPLRIKARTVV
ncbi:11633_t:CDS:2 [Funneliformis mosseae]|uniref:11633_t:CDS:1 n=1 Tax=Funneliformis mosseae TaxID=27381 RepID=A0A9N9EE25_FUNMO|nr:11633_t:CDS:2 [Funneliformis mosseae]